MKNRWVIPLIILIFLLLFLSNKTSLENHIGNRINAVGVIDEVLTNGRYIVLVDNINEQNINEKILLRVIGEVDLELGDRIQFNGVLDIPMKNTNPKLFNYRLHLLSDKIYTTMTIKDYSLTKIENEKELKYRVKEKFKRDVEELFNHHLSRENSSIITSIILGESSYLNEEELTVYRDLGLAHILAVSGLHIGIISGFLIFILARLGINRKLNIFMTLTIIFFYGFLIGYPPSIVRATFMFSLLFYSQIVHEPYDSINSLSLACIVLLLINPYFLFNIGFQLSFIAAFSIVFFTPYVKRIFYPRSGKVWDSLYALLGVNIGLLPIQLFYFNKLSILSIVANLILIPLFSFSLILGFIMVLCNYIFSPINMLVGGLLNFLLNIQRGIIDVLNLIPFNIIKVASPGLIYIVLYFIFILIILKIIDIEKLNKRIVKTIMIYLTALIIINTVYITMDKSMELHFIDVGQGDSILIRTKRGDFLMDTGGGPNTLPYLEKIGVNRLKAVIITHFHDDHAKVLPLLMENLKVDNIIASYIPENVDIPILLVREKDRLVLDENLVFSFLWPDDNSYSNENNRSLVTLISYYNRNILFTGDIESEVESFIADKINEKIDILKVPHHGSKTSSTDYFLNKLNPEAVIISVGRNNFYNHPSDEVINRYENMGIDIYRTDYDGLIKVKLDKDRLYIDPFIKDKKDFFNLLKDEYLFLSYYLFIGLVSYILIKMYLHKGVDLVELQ